MRVSVEERGELSKVAELNNNRIFIHVHCENGSQGDICAGAVQAQSDISCRKYPAVRMWGETGLSLSSVRFRRSSAHLVSQMILQLANVHRKSEMARAVINDINKEAAVVVSYMRGGDRGLRG